MGQRGCHSIQSERSRCPGQRFHGRPTGDRVRVHHLFQSLPTTLARCTWRVLEGARYHSGASAAQ
jgi:hypothetical protein